MSAYRYHAALYARGQITSTDGVLAAAGLVPTASFAGTVTASGALAATPSVPVAALAGTVTVSGTLASSPPPPAAEVAGTVTVSGALASTLPMPVAALVGTAELPTGGALIWLDEQWTLADISVWNGVAWVEAQASVI